MAQDKFSALWVSHSRIKDFEMCPRSYFLKYLYRSPKTNHKIKLMTPPLALGQIVHDVLESLRVLPVKDRFKDSLVVKLHTMWGKIEGKKGGFPDSTIEQQYKTRAETMLLRVMKDPGPLTHLAVKLQMDLPYYWLSEEKNIILSGKLDWMEYLEKTDSVHIIDFKTSKHEEDESSLQLPIYYLLAKKCQNRHIAQMSYWYLEREQGSLVAMPIPDSVAVEKTILEKALEIQLALKLQRFKCHKPDGCFACKPYEEILKGNAEFVGINSYREDVYVLDAPSSESKESEIL
jgi:CRISPR/Cas system-associated exonuclease Cas4 (RecB family)